MFYIYRNIVFYSLLLLIVLNKPFSMALDYNSILCMLKNINTDNIGLANASSVFHDNHNSTEASFNATQPFIRARRDNIAEHLIDIINSTIFPFLYIFGIIGNILNITVLSYHLKTSVSHQSLQIVALAGLIGLAVSDLCYCLFGT